MVPTGLCRKCQKRPATVIWTGEGGVLSFVHGAGEPRCERCCITEQIEFARKLMDGVPALELRLLELIGAELISKDPSQNTDDNLKETT